MGHHGLAAGNALLSKLFVWTVHLFTHVNNIHMTLSRVIEVTQGNVTRGRRGVGWAVGKI